MQKPSEQHHFHYCRMSEHSDTRHPGSLAVRKPLLLLPQELGMHTMRQKKLRVWNR